MTNTKEEAIEYINKFIAEVNYAIECGAPISYINGETVLAKLHTILHMVQNINVGQEVKTEQFVNESLSLLDDAFDEIKKEGQNE